MAHVLKPRVAETSTTTGTGAFTLSAALDGHQRFSAVMSTSDTTDYMIVADDGTWEEGIGTYSSANTLTRTTVTNSSNAGSVVNFAAGSKTVLMTPVAARVGAIPRGGSTGHALVKASAADHDAVWAAVVGVASDVQTFSSSGTWTKPAGATWVYVEVTGGGGGGGSGRRGTAAGQSGAGGGGGGGGGGASVLLKAADLSSTVSVTVGAGGTGGAAQTVDATSGNAGGAGGTSSFGSYCEAAGGFGGEGGTNSNGNSVSGGNLLAVGGTRGLLTGTPPDTVFRNTPVQFAGGGGGAGGGADGSAGGNAAASVFGARATGGSAEGGAGQSGSNGGGGGGGGGVSAAGNVAGGAGGAGAQPGGGGGGGGATRENYNSGAGGSGGNGRVVVYSW